MLLPSPEIVREAVARVGLPPPKRVHRIRTGIVRTFEVELAPPDAPPVWLRIPLPSVGLPPLAMEHAILGHLRGEAPRNDVGELYSVVRVGRGVPVALTPRPAGDAAVRFVGDGGDDTALGEAVGRWLKGLPTFGHEHATAADGRAFHREHASWADAVEAELVRAQTRLARYGWGLGAVGAALEKIVRDGLHLLETVDRFGPVHRDFGPDRVWLADGEVSAVVDWDRAWVGDPLMGWAWLCLQPAEVLGPILRGAGADLRAVADRLEVYAALEILARLDSRILGSDTHAGTAAIAAMAVSEAATLQAGLDAHLAAASGATGTWPGWSPDPVEHVLRRLLHRMCTDGDRLDRSLEHGIAAALLADTEALAQDQRAAWLDVANRIAADLPTRGEADVAHPEDPLPAALSRAQRVPGPVCSGAATGWLVTRALERVEGIDPATHTAAARRVERQTSGDGRAHVVGPSASLAWAVQGTAAALGSDVAGVWSTRLNDEWDLAGTLVLAHDPDDDAPDDPNATPDALTAIDPLANPELAPTLLALLTLQQSGDITLPDTLDRMLAAARG
jgi:hypothetical protein